MPKETIPSEASITAAICRRLDRLGPTCWYFKKHGGAFGRRGIPDIIGTHGGRSFALEVKRPKVGVVSRSQEVEMQQMANAGVLVAVVESVEDVEHVLQLN